MSTASIVLQSGIIPDAYPPPHRRYVVIKEGLIFTATPCYGMHRPWWVAKIMDGTEADPVDMKDGDRWDSLKDFLEKHGLQPLAPGPGSC